MDTTPATKTCSACGLELPRIAFYKRPSAPDRLRGQCKNCIAIKGKDWEQRNRHKRKEISRRAAPNQAARKDWLKRVYGLTPAQYESMVLEQGGVCAICNRPEETTLNGARRSLAVDHCHATNRVRALLCGHCNKAIGLAREDIGILRAMISYLELHAADEREVA